MPKNPDRNEESTVLVYNAVNQDNLVAKDDKEKLAKKDNRFLKLHYNGEVIYIRKFTLVWILQGQHVSADRGRELSSLTVPPNSNTF